MQSHNPEVRRPRFGLFPVRSPLLRESIFLSFPQGNEMFQFPWLSSITYGFSYGSLNITSMRLPHSDISGSKPAYGSPKLFAVNHVLLRLLAPRHPPYALIILTFFTHISMRARFSVIRRLRLYLFAFLLHVLCSFQRTASRNQKSLGTKQ